jgi:hypothetical protein
VHECRHPDAPERVRSCTRTLCFVTSDLVERVRASGNGAPLQGSPIPDSCSALRFVGRSGEMVKVAGRNVALRQVENVLRAHHDVVSAVATALVHPVTNATCIAALIVQCGSEAAADVQSKGVDEAKATSANASAMAMPAKAMAGPELVRVHTWPDLSAGGTSRVPASLESALRLCIAEAEETSAVAQPACILAVQALPVNSSGKVSRSAAARHPGVLAALAAAMPASREGHADAQRMPQMASPQHPIAHASRLYATQQDQPEAVLKRSTGSEATVLAACAAVLGAAGAGLEPSTSLLEAGFTSLHMMAAAEQLGTTAAIVLANHTPRKLAAALRELAEGHAIPKGGAAASVAAPGRERNKRKRSRSMAEIDATPLTIGSVEVLHRSDSLIARNGGTAGMSRAELAPERALMIDDCVTTDVRLAQGWQQQALQLRASDSRAERTGCVPVRGQQAPRLCCCATARKALQLMRGGLGIPRDWTSQEGLQPLPKSWRRWKQLDACVDAPLTVLSYSVAAADVDKLEWLVACSHSGRIACVCVQTPGCLAWEAAVPTAPDAGVQVTACGLAAVVAGIDGWIYLVHLADGLVSQRMWTGGQLRRCVY